MFDILPVPAHNHVVEFSHDVYTQSRAKDLGWPIPAVLAKRKNSRGSREGNKANFGKEAIFSLKSTPVLSTQTWTCWKVATCTCVFSRSHSPLMADLLVRYLLKSYILVGLCFDIREFKVSRQRGLAKHRFQNWLSFHLGNLRGARCLHCR